MRTAESTSSPVQDDASAFNRKRALFRVVHDPDGYRIDDTRIVAVDHLLEEACALRGADAMVLATDPFGYTGVDQVIPLQPEQLFVLDELRIDRLREGRLVEVGAGSGVLSIGALRAGAGAAVALEINPRAINFSGFNAMINGVEDRLEVRTGDRRDVFAPLGGERFDYLISNPPFEPTPPGMDYYLSSAAGLYGLDFIEHMLPRLEAVLSPRGHAQIVTMAPGDKASPTGLLRLLETHLPGRAITIRLDRQPIGYGRFLNRFTSWFAQDPAALEPMLARAQADGITHLHFCMIHLAAGELGSCRVIPTERLYEDWTTPLGSDAVDECLGARP